MLVLKSSLQWLLDQLLEQNPLQLQSPIKSGMVDITLVVDGNLFKKLVNFDASPEGKESVQGTVNPVQQKMVKNANFLSFIREKNMRLAPRILTIQVKLGVQHEQTGNLLRGTVNWSGAAMLLRRAHI